MPDHFGVRGQVRAAGILAAFLAVTPAYADNGTASNPYSENFNQRHSYYHHTLGDDAALTTQGVSSGAAAGYIQITGSGRKVSGLNPGDYLLIQTTGQTFQTMGLFTNGTAIRGRTGYQNRFQSIATNQLQVLSLRDESAYPNFKGTSGQWSGQAAAQQSSDMKHFRISPASGNNPGIIVRVPDGATHLFKSADVSSFSTLGTTGCTIKLTKLDPANRPRFYLHTSSVNITEDTPSPPTGPTSLYTYNLRIVRDTSTAYQVRVNYNLDHITTDGDDLEFPSQAGTLEFGENVEEMTIPIQIRRDNIHEDDETFRLNLSIDPRNNPNEAYVNEPGTESRDWTITLENDDVPIPLAVTEEPTEIKTSSSILWGTVNPMGGETTVYFQYGTTTLYGNTTEPQIIPAGNNAVDVSATVAGLAENTTYHYRIVAENAAGTVEGADVSFQTALAPLVATANPVAVTTTSATLMGAVNPRGRETTVYFQYGATTLYGNTTEPQTIPAGNGAVEVIAPVAGLAANATYHYRIVAENAGGTAAGADVSFQAKSGGEPTAPPSVTTGAAGEITTGAATLAGTVNPNGGFTNAFFEYGVTAALGEILPNLGAGNGPVPTAISWNLSGLEPGTTYHFRLVASNSLGTTHGAIQTFSTVFPPPIVVTGGVVPAGTTGAQIGGTVRARGAAAAVHLDYGTDGVSFPNSVAAIPATVDGDDETPVVANLTNLQQGVTYHFRLRAVNSGGTGFGETASFTPAILSGLTRQFPAAPPGANGSVTVNLLPEGIATGWRFTGEREWRESGGTATGLTAGDRQVEFRPVAGHIHPLPEIVSVTGGSVEREYDYYETEVPATGGLMVWLKPDELSGHGIPDAERPKWRLLGGGDWKNSGETLAGLPAGRHLIECREVAGRAMPPVAAATVEAGETSAVTITYFLAPSATGAAPVPLDFPTVSTDQSLPYAHVGQIRSDAGLASGFVVKPRVVATAAHVVFDDGSLSFATGLQWLFQRDRGVHEPVPQTPRGFYIFDGYAALREAENTPGESSPQSQNLDVAALYFNEDAGRGGSYGGFLASDTLVNEFLTSSALKTLAGYPVDGVSASLRGQMHATAPVNAAFTAGFGRTHSTTDIRGTGGMSGGPLCVQHANGHYYPAAVFLGGTAQTVVRAIDSTVIDLFNRAEVSGNGGDNNTGGGISHTGVTQFGNSAQPGALRVNIGPEAARLAGATWSLKPSASAMPGGFQIGNLNPATYSLTFSAVPGFQTPPEQMVTVTGGQVLTVDVNYGTELTPLEAWRQSHFGTTANTGDAADNFDADGDGQSNLDEYTAGTNPKNPADVFKVLSTTRAANAFTLVAPGKAGRIYILERRHDLGSGSWQTVPGATAGPLAADGPVTLTDPASPPDRAFYRARVSLP